MFIRLAWKNIWRNKKRTIIVSASVFFAVILAVVMRSAQLGSYAYMIESSAKMQTGYLQIQGKGFWENRSMDKSIILSDSFVRNLGKIEGIASLTPRLEGFALLSNDSTTRVSAVIGIDPDKEHIMTGLKDKLIAGSFLAQNSKSILLAEGLAKRLRAGIGDTLVLYGSGYHGQIAAALLPVEGIMKLPLPQLNNGLAFLSLGYAQYIYSAPQRITSLSIMLDNVNRMDNVENAIDQKIEDKLTLMTWDEMIPELKQSIQIDNASGIIMIGILYMVIAFGVFGTIMMMTAEREKEFGILNSVGMKKIKMMIVSAIEGFMVSFIGVIVGVLLSIPITMYLKQNPIWLSGDSAKAWESLGIQPIMTFSTSPDIYFWQSMVVFFIALICVTYPLLFIGRLQPVKALKK